jgi:hypothetical protein
VATWRDVEISHLASNLSNLGLTLGEVVKAMGSVEQSVTCADRSGIANWPSKVRLGK